MRRIVQFFVDCLDYAFYRAARLAIVEKSLFPYESSAATFVGFCIWAILVVCIELILFLLGIHHRSSYIKYLLIAILVVCYVVYNEDRYRRLKEKYKEGIQHKRLKDSIVVSVFILSLMGLIMMVYLPR